MAETINYKILLVFDKDKYLVDYILYKSPLEMETLSFEYNKTLYEYMGNEEENKKFLLDKHFSCLIIDKTETITL